MSIDQNPNDLNNDSSSEPVGALSPLVIWIWVCRLLVTFGFLIGLGLVLFLVLVLFSIPYGTNVPGTITGFDLLPNRNGAVVFMQYEFKVDGITKHGSQSVSNAIHDRYSKVLADPGGTGRDVDVRYYTIGPLQTSNLPQFASAESKAKSLAVLALIWNAIVAAMMYIVWFKVLGRRSGAGTARPLPV